MKCSTIRLPCVLVLATDSEPILGILNRLTDGSAKPDSVTATAIRKIEGPHGGNDAWLHHDEAAEYWSIPKSTLYRYAEHGHIESRKLGKRLEYRALRVVLDLLIQKFQSITQDAD